MRCGNLALGLLFLVAARATAGSPLPASPVAVLPFKNLNADPSIDWLRAGIAETMISDLRKSSKVQVVERDQVDRAMGEIALQEQGGEDAASVKVGKLVGAKTLVLGSFQKAGSELRINARFVSVETGVVIDTAKTTGPVTKVFSLQDQVVDRLLGVAPPARPKRKATEKTLDAYRLYSLALTVASDSDKVGYLKQSLGSDPDFVYAKDDLAALEARLNGYQAARQAALPPPPDQGQRKIMEDTSASPRDRAMAAMILLDTDQSQRRYRALVDDCNRILALNLAASGNLDLNVQASWALIQAYAGLKQTDLAMQAGERFLKEHPTSSRYPDTDRQMRELIRQQRMKEPGQARVDKRFAQLDALRSGKSDRHQLSTLDLEKCTLPNQDDVRLFALSLQNCKAFVQQYGSDADPGVHNRALNAGYLAIVDLAELGRWEEAIPQARSFVAENPASAWATMLKNKMSMEWPADVVP